jgi:hypothetical protein
MQSISSQRLGKHISAYWSVIFNALTSSSLEMAFSMGSVQSAYKSSEFTSKFSSGQLQVSRKLEE